jgi:signal transduction histidine kinase/DNA-binding response OmpR family regulator
VLLKRSLGFFCCLFLFLFWGFSQNYADSALALYEQIDTEALPENEQVLLDTSRKYFSPNTVDSLVVGAIKHVGSYSNHEAVQPLFNALFGRIADQYFEKATTEKDRRKWRDKKASFHLSKAIFCYDHGDFKCATDNIYDAIDVWEEIADTSQFITGYLIVSSWYMSDQVYAKSDSIIARAQAIATATGDSGAITNVLFYSGVNEQLQRKYEQAIHTFNSVLPWFMRYAHPIQQVNVLERIAQAYTSQQKYDEASIYFERALAIAKGLDDFRLLSSLYTTGGDIYFAKEEWKKAEDFGLLSLQLTQTYKSPYLQYQATDFLHKVYRQGGRYREALEMQTKAIRLQDSIRSEDNRRALLDKEYAYRYEKQITIDSLRFQAQITLEQADKRRRTYFSWFLLGITILLAVFGYLLWNRYQLTQKQKQALDKANEELKALDETKSRFFTNISHELKTPLTVISGIASMIEQPEQKELISRNSNNLLNLVNQILDLRKLEANKLAFNMKRGDILPYLKYLMESFESYAESKSISLSFYTEWDEFVMDYDADRISSMVSNLLSNAIKFTPTGGKVSLSVSGSDYGVQNGDSPNPKSQSPGSLTITVSDTGIGIPPEKLPHIFDRFYQVDDSSTRENEGTGIGLTFTHDLVQAFGGTIEVESNVNQGSTFTLILPVTRSAPLEEVSYPIAGKSTAAAKPLAMDVGRTESPYTLLIVEDNEDVMQYLQLSLAPSYQLLLAKDGQEGIAMALEHVPDIIISDVMMPRKDGFELCQTLKEDDRASHIPIILLTAKSDAESRISGLQRGADAYLPKPFDQRELLIRLENLIRLRQHMQIRYQKDSPPTPSKDAAVQKEDAFIQKIKKMILEHLDDPELNTSTFTEMVGLSRSQLHKKIKALTGLSTSHFIRLVRLQEARKMLNESDMQIAEIAYACGFSSPTYFSKVFSEAYNKTPQMYRKG